MKLSLIRYHGLIIKCPQQAHVCEHLVLQLVMVFRRLWYFWVLKNLWSLLQFLLSRVKLYHLHRRLTMFSNLSPV